MKKVAPRTNGLREGLAIWAAVFCVLMGARYGLGPLVPIVADNLKAIAIIGFLYVPAWFIWRRGESFAYYGLTLRNWRRDLAWALGLAALVFPVFALGFWAFISVVPQLPVPLADALSPYAESGRVELRLPPGLPILLAIHLLVVALPEEFFYRGWLYARLSEGLDESRRGRYFLGVLVGPAFFITALLFAVGHLTEPHLWRLGVFFPALIFGWLRLRTGGLLAPIVFHGLSNVYIAVLEASFYPE